MHGGSHADATLPRALGARPQALACPVQCAGALVQAFLQPGAADVPAVHRGLAQFDRVDAVHMDRVQAEHAGHGVDVAVQRELHLRAAEAPKGAVGWRVGVGQPRARSHIGVAVHVVAAHGADMHDLGRQSAVGAAVGQDVDFFGHNHSVLVHSQPQSDLLGQAGGGG